MSSRIRSHISSNVVSYVALFVALGGTGAYAANTIGSSDVINDSLLSEDVKAGTLVRGDLTAETLSGNSVLDESLSFFDLAPGTIVNSRLADSAVNSARVAPESLTGADIDESSFLKAKVVARPRQTGSATSGASGTETTLTRTAGSWTQPADEAEQLGGQATVTAPELCPHTVAPPGALVFKFGGVVIGTRALEPGTDTQTIRFSIGGVPGPGTPTLRTLTITILDRCNSADNFTVSNLKVDVAGTR